MKNYLLSAIVLLLSFNLLSQNNTSYYFSKVVNLSYENAIEKTKAALKKQEFGVITEIDMHEKLAEKIDNVDIKPYKILGACNPVFAYETLKVEENIGLFLPCKVLVKKIDEKSTEIVMVNPSALMKMLGNEKLIPVAEEVTIRFRKALEDI